VNILSRWRFERALKPLRESGFPKLEAYAQADWPAPDILARDAPYLALDFELDGLRKGAHLLQAGWAAFEGRKLRLNDAHVVDIRSYAELDREAVTIHGIGEERAAQGEPIVEAIRAIIVALTGRIMIAHGASIEQTALSGTIRALTGLKFPVRRICTLMLERQLHPNLTGGDAYRLGPTRARYGLPEYQPHDALTDAIAAAELFAAQLTRLPDEIRLSELENL